MGNRHHVQIWYGIYHVVDDVATAARTAATGINLGPYGGQSVVVHAMHRRGVFDDLFGKAGRADRQGITTDERRGIGGWRECIDGI